MSTMPQNPFSKEESLQTFFEADQEYMHTKKTQRNYFTTTMKNPQSTTQSIFASIKLFFKAHTVTSILIIALITSTLGVAAAELIAPTAIKPSSLLITNKQETLTPKTEYTTTSDGFTFAYNTEDNVLTVTGEAELLASCYTITSSEIIATTKDTLKTLNLYMTAGVVSESTITDTTNCQQTPYTVKIDQTFTLDIAAEDLERFDTLFAVTIKQDPFEPAQVEALSKPFVADDMYDVAVNTQCDLAFKYQRTIARDAITDALSYSEYKYEEQPTQFAGTIRSNKIEAQLLYSCDLNGQIVFDNKVVDNIATYSIESVPTKEFCDLVQLTQESCDLLPKNIRKVKDISGTHYDFVYKTKYYDFNVNYAAGFQKGELTIQFNSLAPSTATAINTALTNNQPASAGTATTATESPRYKPSIPNNHTLLSDICANRTIDATMPAISYQSDYLVSPRTNNDLFIKLSFADRLNGYALYPSSSMNSRNVEIDCSRKSASTKTATEFLTKYQNIGYAIDDGTIRPVPQSVLAQWMTPDTINKITNPVFIDINKTEYPLQLIAFEYNDYIITIRHTPEPSTTEKPNIPDMGVIVYLP